ncbi:DegT/DnrJ/EryC1/StrS family aminotransferase [Candidatus Micrarchaeota archaeon]|nr:DegT/DnrJ/EryC1/StrS family aminotransferase [Candidatus Micrarchaeota archaeon]
MNRIGIGEFYFEEEGKKIMLDIIKRNAISEGKYCREFEKEFAEYIGTKNAVICNSGTSALMLVLQALKYHSKYKIPEGKKVIMPALTYIATANSIATTNFEPVFIDINKDDFCINTELLKEHIEGIDDIKEYAGIMPVHLMGYPAEMNKINKIAEKNGLIVIEDSAEAHGSIYDGKRTGNLSFAGCFSFYLAHNIQVGEVGMITTNDEELTDKCNRLKGNGRLCYCNVDEIHSGKCTHQMNEFHPRYLHDMIGYNFKSMEYQGAIGTVQMKKIKWLLRQRQENVKKLNEGLEELNGSSLILPKHSEEISYLGYPLVVIDEKISRNDIAQELVKKEIENRPIFNSIPTQQPAYEKYRKEYQGKVNTAEYIGNNGIYIGCHQYIKEEEIEYMIKSIKEIFGK